MEWMFDNDDLAPLRVVASGKRVAPLRIVAIGKEGVLARETVSSSAGGQKSTTYDACNGVCLPVGGRLEDKQQSLFVRLSVSTKVCAELPSLLYASPLPYLSRSAFLDNIE
eukprot:scaffold328_cov130-Cylindrotheca_fusiformis.AAC.1